MKRGGWIALGAALLAVFALIGWRRAAPPVKVDQGPRIADVITQHFAAANRLQVATLSGTVQTQARDARLGGVLTSRQATRFPYTVDYSVNLSRIGPQSYRWDAKARTMTVEIGDVAVGVPNIDASRAENDRSGLFITRAAFDSLSRQVAARAIDLSAAAARSEANMARARDNARRSVAQLAYAPLAAAGLRDVRVAVRFAWETRSAVDGSTPLSEIYRR